MGQSQVLLTCQVEVEPYLPPEHQVSQWVEEILYHGFCQNHWRANSLQKHLLVTGSQSNIGSSDGIGDKLTLRGIFSSGLSESFLFFGSDTRLMSENEEPVSSG